MVNSFRIHALNGPSATPRETRSSALSPKRLKAKRRSQTLQRRLNERSRKTDMGYSRRRGLKRLQTLKSALLKLAEISKSGSEVASSKKSNGSSATKGHATNARRTRTSP